MRSPNEQPTYNSSSNFTADQPQLDNAAADEENKLGTDLINNGTQQLEDIGKAKVQVLSQQASTDLDTKLNQTQIEAEQHSLDPSKQQEFTNKTMEAYYQTYKQNLPSQAQPYVEKAYAASMTSVNKNYTENIIKQDIATNQITYLNGLDQNLDNLSAAARRGDFGDPAKGTIGTFQTITGQAIRNAIMAAHYGIITPEQAEADIQKIKDTSRSQGLFGQVQNAPTYEAASKIIEHASNDPQITIPMLKNAQYLLKMKYLGSNVDSKLVGSNFKDAITDLQNTGHENTKALEQMKMLDPENSGYYDKQWNDAKWVQGNVKSIIGSPIEQQEKELNQLQESNPDNYVQVQKVRDAVISAQKSISSRPYNYFAENPNPAISGAQEKVQQIAVSQLKTASPFIGEVAEDYLKYDPVQANLTSQRLYGVKPEDQQVMGDEVSKGLVSRVSQMPNQDKISAINEVLNSFTNDDQKSVAMAQLRKDGLDLSDNFIVEAANKSPQDAPTLTAAFDAPLKDLKKLYEESSNSKYEKLSNEIQQDNLKDLLDTTKNYNSLSPSVTQGMIDDTTRYAAYLISVKNIDPNTAKQKAADVLFYQHYNPIQSYNGEKFRVPNQFNNNPFSIPYFGVAHVGAYLVNKGIKNAALPPNYLIGYPDSDRNARYKNDIATNGYMQTYPDDSGLFLSLPGGIPVKDSNGKNIDMTWDDYLNHPEILKEKSKLSDEINKKINNIGKLGAGIASVSSTLPVRNF